MDVVVLESYGLLSEVTDKASQVKGKVGPDSLQTPQEDGGEEQDELQGGQAPM